MKQYDINHDMRYLQLLAQSFPSIAEASTEIINLQAILNLPKGTEHFLADIHAEDAITRGTDIKSTTQIVEMSNRRMLVADTGIIAGSGSHPEYVVVAPLNIPAMIVAHLVENDVCSWSAIVYVAEYMKLVDGESLYHIGNGYNEIVSTACRDDGIYDDIHVCSLVVIFRMLVQKLLYNIGEIAWQ